MRVDYPGLAQERLPSGAVRYRVRVENNPTRKITLTVAPGHRDFAEHYYAARVGIQLQTQETRPIAARGSVAWLIDDFCGYMAGQLAAGLLHPVTVKQRVTFLEWLRCEVGLYSAVMPQSHLIKLRDKKAATPGAADNFIKTVRAMYAYAVARGLTKANPATGISKINRPENPGATPWTTDDFRTFRGRHPKGTMAHLALTLFLFTACRLGDAYRLGRGHEVIRDGQPCLSWQPEKKGSRRVTIPMLRPLLEATRAVPVQGARTYLLTDLGQPFASKNSLARKLEDWLTQAELGHLSSHGIRKGAGELLALHGATQYQIMAIHGHASARTSEIYTEGADRARLGSQGMALLEGMEW